MESFHRSPENQRGAKQAQKNEIDLVRKMAKEHVNIARKQAASDISKRKADEHNRLENLADEWKGNIDKTLDDKKGKSTTRSLEELLRTTYKQTKNGVNDRAWKMSAGTLKSKLALLHKIEANIPPVHEEVRQGPGPDLSTSDPRLVEEYSFLLRSSRFQPLNQIVASDQAIILEDAAGGRFHYNADAHRISVSLDAVDGTPRSRADIRAELLWEMMNASNRGSLHRADMLNPYPLDANSSPEAVKLYPYWKAQSSLASEWNEWKNIAEYDQLVLSINADPNMGKGKSHVTRMYRYSFEQNSRDWYQFTNYLDFQINSGHTARYDPGATNPNWVGYSILAVAQDRSPASLNITEREVRNWQNKTTRKIKSPSSNPFTSSAIIERARAYHDSLEVTDAQEG